MKNIKEYQILNICFQLILAKMTVKISSNENSGKESRLPGSLKNYEIKILIKTHKTENILQ
jgi:hypothetical protein